MKAQTIAAVCMALGFFRGAAHAQTSASATAPLVLTPIEPALPAPAPHCRHCWERLAHSPAGQLVHAVLTPARFLTGGVVGGAGCHGPTPAEMTALCPTGPASPAETVAAKIKADEAHACARRAAVRYLGTVDCHYWPEAEAGLVAALRCDRNECVRLEAALALANGCCCTPCTVEALNIVVSGSEKDGNPAETSPRVKWAAQTALGRCAACFVPVAPALELPEQLPEQLPSPQKLGRPAPRSDNAIQLAGHWATPPAPRRAGADDLASHQALKLLAETAGARPPEAAKPAAPSARRHLLGMLLQAGQTPEMQPRSAPPQPASLPLPPLTPIGAIPSAPVGLTAPAAMLTPARP